MTPENVGESISEQLRFPLRVTTDPAWAGFVLRNFEDFLRDHAAAERKAHSNCMMLISKYQNRVELVESLLDMALEELGHFQEVIAMLHKRGVVLASDKKDEYVVQLHDHLRPGSDERLMDRLIATSIIEARGCERFGLIGEALIKAGDTALGNYYRELSVAEARHYGAYIRLAKHYFPDEVVEARFEEMLDIEARILASLPLRPALH